jgi:pyruvate formate lyase activating enzyme
VRLPCRCPLPSNSQRSPSLRRRTTTTRPRRAPASPGSAGYARFLRRAGGGLTVSGGEPLLQARFVTAPFEGARALGLHTTLDTSGYLGDRAPDALLDVTDLVLLDIKAGEPAT